MKILQVIPDLRVGGAERVAIHLCRGFLQRGHEVQLVACKEGGPQEELFPDDPNFRFKILGIHRSSIKNPLAFLRDLKKMGRALDQELIQFQPDVVQSHLPEDDLFVAQACRRTGIGAHIPMIHSTQFHIHREGLDFRSRMRLRLHAKALKNAACVIAVSEAVKTKVLEMTKLDEAAVHVLHNGIDLTPYKNLPTQSEARTSIGLGKQGKLVLGVGRLHPAKNYPLFVEASRLVLNRLPETQFALVGEGDQRTPIEAAITQFGVTQNWTLLGQRKDVPVCLKAADVFVQSSDWEGFPITVVEAMAAGVPVVATDVAGIGELLKHNQHGYLSLPGDAEALALGIIQALENPQQARDMAHKAEFLAWQHYNLEAWAEAAESIARKALGSAP
jgi:glycosyltransferase involved in cell wall biosynthesis